MTGFWDGSGISWTICKQSAPCSTDYPTNNSSLSFYRPDALPAAQPTASKHWRHKEKEVKLKLELLRKVSFGWIKRTNKIRNFITMKLELFYGSVAFSALTLLVLHQEQHWPVKIERWGVGGVICGARCRLFAYGSADATAIPKPRHLLPHLNSRLVLPFWYRLTQVVLEKRPLNGYSISSYSMV